MHPDREDILQAFHQFISTFAPIPPAEWQLLETILVIKSFAKNEFLLREGQACRHIDFLFSGAIRFFANQDGQEITTALHLPQSCFTNMKSLVSLSPSHLFIQAAEPAIVARMQKEDLIRLYALSPQLQSFGRMILEHMIIQENDWKEMYTLLDPEERYAFLLQKAPDFFFHFSLSDIASFLGIRRETLSRIRKRFSQ